MFGLFKKKYFLGVDFGTFSLKAVELKIEGGVATLVNFGIADIRDDVASGTTNTVSHEARRIQYLEALLHKMQPHTKEVFVSVPGSSGLIAVVEFPKMNPKELAEAVQFEAHKYVPIDLNEVTLSWDVLRSVGDKKGDEKKTTENVLLVAALKKEIEKTARDIQQVGYAVGAMELETFSLARALVDGDPGTHIIIDIGFRVSNLVLVSGGEVRVNRTIDVGGNDITKTIMDGMSISFDRAEALKKERDFFHQNEIPLTFPAIETILSEVRRMIASFEQQERGRGIQMNTLVLSGGTSLLPGFSAYCQEQMGVSVVIGDPWKKVQYDGKRVSADLVKELGGSLSIALGLALRGNEDR